MIISHNNRGMLFLTKKQNKKYGIILEGQDQFHVAFNS